ncbi:hypothetical protein BKA56DRAFT_673078 [Ilyonectria sp. MPI-CAGE-AT-0026]|nr:hypothetical protein BKA56DRAFT_673078 [Ilyonectria sp. MPI-CAGE-AT-0026]
MPASKLGVLLTTDGTTANHCPDVLRAIVSIEGLGQLDLTTREPRRYMSIILAPYFTPSSHSADWGVYCTRCVDNREPATHFRNKYTEDGFVDHMARYGTNHGGKQAPVSTITPSVNTKMTSGRNSNVQLSATLVDSADVDESEYRFLLDGKHVKYVTIVPRCLAKG